MQQSRSSAVAVIGNGSSSKSLGQPLKLQFTVPTDTPLTITGLTGNVRVGDLRAPVRAFVEAGEVQLGRVGAAVLAVDGSGTIRAAEVTDNAELSLNGTGNITVEGGSV
jgi:hypothetical protein